MKPIEVRLATRYKFQSKIDGIHETLLYHAVHMQTNELVVLKGEEVKTSKLKKSSLGVLQEGKIYQGMQGGIGIPYMHWCGQEEDFNFLVLQELQTSLDKLLARCGGKFSLKTAMMVGIQLTQILQYFHFKSFVYNGLNLRHVMLGRGQNYGNLYLVDYSRSTRFKDSINHDHIPEPSNKSWEMKFANMEFSSLQFQRGHPTTRKDDMQSLMFVISCLLNGQLPWSHETRNMKKTEFDKCRYVVDAKSDAAKKLFKGYPQLQSLYKYTVDLKFNEKPQYANYISTFNRILQKNDLIDDKMYDWMFVEEEDIPLELYHKFDIYQGEKELIQKIDSEITSKKSEGLPVRQQTKIQSLQQANPKVKGQKQCLIY